MNLHDPLRMYVKALKKVEKRYTDMETKTHKKARELAIGPLFIFLVGLD